MNQRRTYLKFKIFKKKIHLCQFTKCPNLFFSLLIFLPTTRSPVSSGASLETSLETWSLSESETKDDAKRPRRWVTFFLVVLLFFPEVLEHAGGKSGLENKGEEEENLEPGGLGDQVGRDGPQPTGDQPSQIFIRAEKNWLAKGDEGRASFCCLI